MLLIKLDTTIKYTVPLAACVICANSNKDDNKMNVLILSEM